MPGYHPYKTDKKPYASNPHGGEHNYAGNTLLTGNKVSDKEEKEPAKKPEKKKTVSKKKSKGIDFIEYV